jgi:hypothetical protein
MTALREAAQQALDLRRLADKFSEGWHDGIKIDASDIILLAEVADALEQPEQEPVAWRYRYSDGYWRFSNGRRVNGCDPVEAQLLYARPPRREWQGLTDEEIDALKAETWGSSGIAPRSASAFARAVEVALKGKNHD